MCHTGLNVKLELKEVTHRFDPVLRNTFLCNEIRAGISTNGIVPNYKLLKISVQKMYGIIIGLLEMIISNFKN